MKLIFKNVVHSITSHFAELFSIIYCRNKIKTKKGIKKRSDSLFFLCHVKFLLITMYITTLKCTVTTFLTVVQTRKVTVKHDLATGGLWINHNKYVNGEIRYTNTIEEL